MSPFKSSPNVEALLKETLEATAASRRRSVEQEESANSNTERVASIGLRVVSEDSSTDRKPRDMRPQWRQRLVEAEHGFAHAFRSESTLVGYAVVIATVCLAAGILKVPGLHLIGLGFVALQAVIVELIRIAIRETSGPGCKSSHVAAAASILAAMVAGAVALGLLASRITQAF